MIAKDKSQQTVESIYQTFRTIADISVQSDLGIEVHRDARAVLSRPRASTTRPTGYRDFDLVTGGGLPSPGLVVFAGDSGIGKSVVLTNMGVKYCTRGDFVAYVSLELDDDRVWDRVAAIMTNTPIRDIHTNPDTIASALEQRLEIGDGLFRVKKMRMTGTTVSHINAYLRELEVQEGRKPDVLLLDYLDLLHPSSGLKDNSHIHIKDKLTTEETNDLAKDWGLLCISASQVIKNKNDVDEFDPAVLAGGTAKVNTSDYVMRLRRNEKHPNIMWAYIIKGRYGGGGCKIPLEYHENTLKLANGPQALFLEYNPRYDRRITDKNTKLVEAQVKAINDGVLNPGRNDDILRKLDKAYKRQK